MKKLVTTKFVTTKPRVTTKARTRQKPLIQPRELSFASVTKTLDGPQCRREMRVVQKENGRSKNIKKAVWANRI